MKMKKWLIPAVMVLCAAIYPVIFTYGQNVAEVDFVEVLPLTLAYSLIALAIFGVFALVTKSPYRSALSAALLSLFLSNYMLIQKAVQLIFVNLKYWHILPIGLFVIGNLIYLLYHFREEKLRNAVSIGSIVLATLLLINLVPAAPTIVQKISTRPVENQTKVQKGEANQPNIYWFIFDECASFPVIESVYGFADKENYNKLLSSGFYHSNSSRNDATDTHVVVTNLLNLDYIVNTSMNLAEIEPHRNSAKLFNILQQHGYAIRGIGDTSWLQVDSLTMDTASGGGETADGRGVSYMLLENTVIAPFLDVGYTENAKLVLDALNYFKNPENINENSSQFNLTYVCSPHTPFLFDENGDDVSAINYSNWDDPKYYLGQYRFIMDQIVEIVETIIQEDPDSVIILQSDHGPRHTPGLTYEHKTSVLNSVYFRGEKIIEIEGKSGVNTLRMILDRLLNTDLGEVLVEHE